MTEIAEHLDSILRQQGTLLWGGYVNMLKTLASVFQSPKHWILEFLQNAEDSGATRFAVELGLRDLDIRNDGKVFTSADFAALCDVNSRKMPAAGFRGYLGIGFKSIFCITNHVQIHSGSYHFEFNEEHWTGSPDESVKPSFGHPWEILPIEIAAAMIPDAFTTEFKVPLGGTRGTSVLAELRQFFFGPDFPKEAILLLNNVKSIEIQSGPDVLTISKEMIHQRTEAFGTCEIAEIVRNRSAGPESRGRYQVVRRIVGVPTEISRDPETDRVRRSDVAEREVGLVFGVDGQNQPVVLQGKLAGVYSFLPVEGEQTGLPFGVFGDYVPQPGRDLVNYGSSWNLWVSSEIIRLFSDLILQRCTAEETWSHFSGIVAEKLRASRTTGPGEDFWRLNLRDPIREFLEHAKVYRDASGDLRRRSDLIGSDPRVERIVGTRAIESLTGAHIADELVSRTLGVDRFGIHQAVVNEELVGDLRDDPARLSELYGLLSDSDLISDYYIGGRQGRDVPYREIRFVLGADGDLHRPPEVTSTDERVFGVLPEFLRQLIPEAHIPLHPVVAQNRSAVVGLRRCGMSSLDERELFWTIRETIEAIRHSADSPAGWRFPEDLIAATRFLVGARGDFRFSLSALVTGQLIVKSAGDLFVPGATLDWAPLSEAGLLPGWQPISDLYLRSLEVADDGVSRDAILFFLESTGAHGFSAERDRALIDKCATEKARRELERMGHRIADVTQHDRLGYDLECQGHCTDVFEVKGMGDPHDLELPESETRAAHEHSDRFHLVFVYNIPSTLDRLGFKIIADPEGRRLLDPVGRARVRREAWIRA